MSIPESENVEKTLQGSEVHQEWEDSYRTEENEIFYDDVFDYVTSALRAKPKSTILDVGCGIGAHSVRLAKRGFSVLGVDFSEYILKKAEINIRQNGLSDNVTLKRESILALSFADGTFDYILCWGVLMHIPDVEKAISELSRVLKQGGILVISEGNMHSLQSMILRNLKLLLGKERATVKRTAPGLEYWTSSPAGMLLTRQADVRWLKNKLNEEGITVTKHVAGQFSELYTRFSSPLLRKLIHLFNRFWFNYVKIPALAFGTILIARKR